jgi:hypothetical protein
VSSSCELKKRGSQTRPAWRAKPSAFLIHPLPFSLNPHPLAFTL